MIVMFPVKSHVSVLYISAVVLTIMFLAWGCGEETTPTGGKAPAEISGSLIYTTGCKDYIYGGSPSSPAVLDCVFWEWDGCDTLSVVHVNSALNCCPGTCLLYTSDAADE